MLPDGKIPSPIKYTQQHKKHKSDQAPRCSYKYTGNTGDRGTQGHNQQNPDCRTLYWRNSFFVK